MLESGTNYESERFCAIDASALNLTYSAFDSCTFEDCNFSKSHWQYASFSECRFKNCHFSSIKLQDCRLQSSIFEECKLVGIDFYKCEKFLHMAFIKSILQTCNFADLNLKGTCFAGSCIREVYFMHADLQEADFSEADLLGTQFHQCNLTKSNFRTAKNYTIDLQTNKLKKARFSFPEAMHLLQCLDIEIDYP